ncbi:hypothetical protein IAQ67_12655 [Paenibacillus peoriae]|uniref:Uncharacterized protein n=1 Tax=Paenibacillus peoriae TaxID=59893 RepID=A0A7H0YFB9_9BACL|nr:hypothetical protein IAQ67_12655 [Paenibacillus peoriae]
MVNALSQFLNIANILEAHGTNPEGWGTDQSLQAEQAQPGTARNRLYDGRIGTAFLEKQCRTLPKNPRWKAHTSTVRLKRIPIHLQPCLSCSSRSEATATVQDGARSKIS